VQNYRKILNCQNIIPFILSAAFFLPLYRKKLAKNLADKIILTTFAPAYEDNGIIVNRKSVNRKYQGRLAQLV
jgi:hypothetical protein